MSKNAEAIVLPVLPYVVEDWDLPLRDGDKLPGGSGHGCETMEQFRELTSGKWWYLPEECIEVHPRQQEHKGIVACVTYDAIQPVHGPEGEIVYLTHRYVRYEAVPGFEDRDVCYCCGYPNTAVDGTSYRHGWDCGMCGGN